VLENQWVIDLACVLVTQLANCVSTRTVRHFTKQK
jgi:hypothetical protein